VAIRSRSSWKQNIVIVSISAYELKKSSSFTYKMTHSFIIVKDTFFLSTLFGSGGGFAVSLYNLLS
jgi:hypothetical protein